jgi:hypothetical protein
MESTNRTDPALVTADLVERLGRVLPAVVTEERSDGRVVTRVGGGVPALILDPAMVVAVEPVTTPLGDPAVRIVRHVPEQRSPVVVMVVEGDVVFAPDPVAVKARAAPGPVPRPLAEMPPVIGYHEVRRLIASGDDLADHDELMGLAMAVATGVAGAIRVGLDARGLVADLDALIERSSRR